ncbi:hypothetical protein BpHYR1_048934 [Brachionus plicatilis]|uniref:Uncharacterized protein n=1 Tax=Brachionus plicatilis TaxID=10195 RepID=A0A3M7QSL2_BRAPC|nr:hypothetical protein BpHYR1_048934 [Brachionus plicatilis]
MNRRFSSSRKFYQILRKNYSSYTYILFRLIGAIYHVTFDFKQHFRNRFKQNQLISHFFAIIMAYFTNSLDLLLMKTNPTCWLCTKCTEEKIKQKKHTMSHYLQVDKMNDVSKMARLKKNCQIKKTLSTLFHNKKLTKPGCVRLDAFTLQKTDANLNKNYLMEIAPSPINFVRLSRLDFKMFQQNIKFVLTVLNSVSR